MNDDKVLPTERIRGYMWSAANVLLPDHPASLKEEFVRHMLSYADNWRHEHGLLMSLNPQWGMCDARIRAAANEQGVTFAQLAALPDAELLRIPNFGRGSLKRLRSMFPQIPGGPYGKT
jgi:hypothetical protein